MMQLGSRMYCSSNSSSNTSSSRHIQACSTVNMTVAVQLYISRRCPGVSTSQHVQAIGRCFVLLHPEKANTVLLPCWPLAGRQPFATASHAAPSRRCAAQCLSRGAVLLYCRCYAQSQAPSHMQEHLANVLLEVPADTMPYSAMLYCTCTCCSAFAPAAPSPGCAAQYSVSAVRCGCDCKTLLHVT
jgi:hypothetical protein